VWGWCGGAGEVRGYKGREIHAKKLNIQEKMKILKAYKIFNFS
jgi:hypothetical protein